MWYLAEPLSGLLRSSHHQQWRQPAAASSRCPHDLSSVYMICDFVERGIICQRELRRQAPYGADGRRTVKRR